MHRVFLLPRRCLHLVEAGPHDDLDVTAAEPPRAAAAIHRGVTAAEHDHALADAVDVPEGHARQPVDADVDVLRRFLAARNIEIASTRRAAADEDRVVLAAVPGEQRLETVDTRAATKFDADVEHVTDFLVDDRFRQAEFRNLAADHATRALIAVVDDAFVAERCEVTRDRERRRSGADQRDALAIRSRALGQEAADVVLVVGRDPLEAADRHRLGLGVAGPVLAVLDPATAARGLARPIARPAQNAGKDVGLPVDHVGVVETPRCDQTNVFRYRRVGRAGPLAIDDFMEVIGRSDIRRFQYNPPCRAHQDAYSSL